MKRRLSLSAALPYAAVFRVRLSAGMQYRAAAFAGICTQLFWGIMLIMVFQAFYVEAGIVPPMSLKELVSYQWLIQAFLTFINLWMRDGEIFSLITSGNVAYELCRPTGLYLTWYMRLLAQRIAAGLLRCAPILVLALCLPEPWRLTLPPDAPAFFLFVATLLFGLALLVAVSMLMYISVFHTMSPGGSSLLFSVLCDFASGMTVPLPLMPDWLRTTLSALPFRLIVDLPFRTWSGHINRFDALCGIGQQILWLSALVAVGKIWLDRSVRRVATLGG